MATPKGTGPRLSRLLYVMGACSEARRKLAKYGTDYAKAYAAASAGDLWWLVAELYPVTKVGTREVDLTLTKKHPKLGRVASACNCYMCRARHIRQQNPELYADLVREMLPYRKVLAAVKKAYPDAFSG